ncbi:cytochrome c oxidase subunit 2 [Rhizobium sp. SG_E_25_P2]|uniref:cytochrome c oxidase subunit II n=1 Tax=Rhizobium sp. SG_E_25_P2 TaxID=2879942 RepID=UPI0024750B60|nr:cytochrome c oxidase subunit II [Rhizobium sp. SG_E_25_P2]MDH6266600.1 cytochrome c oxidase subunit 2 [Rhizobium sp. SG_E_25_P2]
MKNKALGALATLFCLGTASSAFADKPVEWQVDLQQAATPIMQEVRWFNHYTLWFIVPITLLVLGLLLVVIVRFRASKNPVPSKTSHHTLIEVVWTVAPVIILLFFAIPSFQLLTNQLTQPENPDLTVKVIGTQWKWSYEYPGETPLSFDSLMLEDADRAALGKDDRSAYPRLLAVDNEMVVPLNKTVRVIVTADPTDVIHSFAMQSFGIKVDAVPGRMNETWFKAEKEGLFYGQCSELCGKDHAFMPIAIRVVSEDKYKAWLAAAATDLPGANKALIAAVEADKSVDVAQNAAN